MDAARERTMHITFEIERKPGRSEYAVHPSRSMGRTQTFLPASGWLRKDFFSARLFSEKGQRGKRYVLLISMFLVVAGGIVMIVAPDNIVAFSLLQA
jgi:hypothetical protein